MSESKIVVFDLDETLGYFTQLCIIWEALNSYLQTINSTIELKQDYFNKLLDIFPEFIRPNIEIILRYLIEKKTSNKCKNVMIYTNNKRQKNWVYMIKKYFENKIKNDLFDQIIRAFKINGKQVELCRSSHNKSHIDFINCSKIPNNTQICFIDDTYFPDMHNINVYYIKVKPYIYCLNIETILCRLKKSLLLENLVGSRNIISCANFIKEQLNMSRCHNRIKSMKEFEIDKIISKQILNHIENFFNNQKNYPCVDFSNTNKTKKNNKNKTKNIINNKTKRLKKY